MADGVVDILLENLKQLISCECIYHQFPMTEKHQIEILSQELSFLSTFLKDSGMSRFEHNEVKDLVTDIRDLAYESGDIIDSSMVNAILNKNRRIARDNCQNFHPSRTLSDVLKEIKSLKKEVSEIYEKKLYGIGDPNARMCSVESSSSTSSLPIVEEETVVGFDHDVDTIRERLDDGCGSKQLDVISIVGMAGLGKTTLTKRLYNDPFVVYHFYTRGWTYVSQVYAKRDLLISILSSVVEHSDKFYSMSDEKLGEELYKRLKGRRYLIVMDDMWNTKAWDDMRMYFPNDNNGSRIVITSRLTEVALHAKLHSPPHFLHFLTKDESWDILKQKVLAMKVALQICWKLESKLHKNARDYHLQSL